MSKRPAKSNKSKAKKSESPRHHQSNVSLDNSFGNTDTSFYNFIKKFWGIIGVFITITGVTIFNFLPSLDFSLKSNSDPNLLWVEVQNKSIIKITEVKPVLFIDKITTLQGDDVKRKQMMGSNYFLDKLGGHEKYTIDYSLNEMLFNYKERPELFEAQMAIVVSYKFLYFNCSDTFFVKCQPDFHGNYLWVETPELDYVDEMNRDTTKAKFEDIPFLRRMIEEDKLKNIPHLSSPQPPK